MSEKEELKRLLEIKDKILQSSKVSVSYIPRLHYNITIDQEIWHEIFKTERANVHGLIK